MQRGEAVSLAGYRFFNHQLDNVSMTFRTEDAKPLKIDLPKIGVLIPTKISREALDTVKDIPSIIGNDFLEDYGFALYFNPTARVAYLERLEKLSNAQVTPRQTPS